MSLRFLLKSFSDEDIKPKKAKPTGISLAGVLQRQLVRRKKLKKPHLASKNFSPSLITYSLCHRSKIAQLAGLTEIYSEVPTPKLQFKFDLGHAIHKIIQDNFWDCNMLEGDFYCIKCDKKFYARSPTTCPFRKSHERRHLSFKEYVLKNEEYRISGRCDGFVWVEISKNVEELHVQDIKSISNRKATDPEQAYCYEDLDTRGPKPDHIAQLNFYMWISGIHKGHLFYVSKGTEQKKSFYVEFDYAVIEPYLLEIKDIIDKAALLESGQEVELPNPCSRKDCSCEQICI